MKVTHRPQRHVYGNRWHGDDAAAPKPNTRMLGAIVEAKQGSVFFKLAGPKKTRRAEASIKRC